MFARFKLVHRMIGTFVITALIAVVVGGSGYYSHYVTGASYDGAIKNRLPGTIALYTLVEAQTAVSAGERVLVNPQLVGTALRKAQYGYIDAAFARADEAWKQYDALRTPEENSSWEAFVSKWNVWKDKHAKVKGIAKEKDRLVDAGVALDDPRVKALDSNAISAFSESQDALQSAQDALRALVRANELAGQTVRKSADTEQMEAGNIVVAITVVAFIVIVALGVFAARSVTVPLALIVRMTQEMSARHLGMRLLMNRQDEIGVMANAMNQLAQDLQENVISPLNQIAAGNLYVEVEPRDSQDGIALALKEIIGSLRGLVVEADALAQATAEGRLTARGNPHLFQGGYSVMLERVNDALDAVTGPLQVTAQHIAQLAEGDIPPKFNNLDRGDWGKIQSDLNRCTDTLNALAADAAMLAEAAAQGKLSIRADTDRYRATFRQIAVHMNDTLHAAAAPLTMTAEYIGRIATGDIPARISDDYRGDWIKVKDNLGACADAINALTANMNMLAQAMAKGQLAVRADASRHQGRFQEVVQGVNAAQSAVMESIRDACRVLTQLAQGDLTAQMKEYHEGDFALLKKSLDAMSSGLGNLALQARQASFGLSVATTHIRASSNQMADIARQQANAIIQMTSTVQATRSSTEQSVRRAQEMSRMMDELAAAAQASAQAMQQVATGTERRTVELDQIAIEMNDVNQAVQDTLENAQQWQTMADNLMALSQQLGETAARYRFKGYIIEPLESQPVPVP